MYRVENKYVLTANQMNILENKISKILAPDKFSKEGAYTISSLYFDDIKDSFYNDTLDGIDERDKYRVRIYNNSKNLVKLEVKHKKESKILKKSETVDWMDFLNRIDSIFTMMRPKVIITYERSAYVYEFGNVRITFDRNLRYSKDTELFGEENIVYDYVGDLVTPSGILEVKYDEFLPQFIRNILNSEDGLVQIAYSKYAICRDNMNHQ